MFRRKKLIPPKFALVDASKEDLPLSLGVVVSKHEKVMQAICAQILFEQGDPKAICAERRTWHPARQRLANFEIPVTGSADPIQGGRLTSVCPVGFGASLRSPKLPYHPVLGIRAGV
jgi:hypothetical protein